MADTTEQGELVGLEAHPGATPEAEAPPGQLARNVTGVDAKSGGQAFNGDDKALAVGFTGGEKAEHDQPSY